MHLCIFASRKYLLSGFSARRTHCLWYQLREFRARFSTRAMQFFTTLRELCTLGRLMSRIGYSGIEGSPLRARPGLHSPPGAVVQRRRNLSSLTVTTQHRSSQYISHDVRRPDSLIFRSPPLPPDPVPCCSLPIRFPAHHRRLHTRLLCVHSRCDNVSLQIDRCV